MLWDKTVYLRCLAIAALALALAGCAEAATEAADDVDDDYTVLVNEDDVQGEPGRYALTARAGFEAPLAVLDVPAGYAGFGIFALWPEDDGTDRPFSALNYWGVHAVYGQPCRSAAGATAPGDSVEELAQALADQDLTSATEPVPVSLDGHTGLFVELTVPRDIDVESCDEGALMLWQGSPGDQHHFVRDPGLVERLWILDVNGRRVVLSTLAAPGVPRPAVDELTEIVESVRFVQPD